MYKTILATLFFVPFFAHAFSTRCWMSDEGVVHNSAIGIEEELNGWCVGETSDIVYKFKISGAGAGLRLTYNKGFSIQCPFKQKVPGSYYGVHAVAAFGILGAHAGTFVYRNEESAGICGVVGYEAAAIGGSLHGARLVIENEAYENN